MRRVWSSGDPRREARRHLANLAAIVRRVENFEGTGRNYAATEASARWNFERALRAVVAVEDAEGIDAAAALSDRLTALRQRATAAGVLSVADVARVESEVTSCS